MGGRLTRDGREQVPRRKWNAARFSKRKAELQQIRSTLGVTGERLLGEFFEELDYIEEHGEARDERRRGPVRAFAVPIEDAVMYGFLGVQDSPIELLHVWAVLCPGADRPSRGRRVWRCPPPQASWDLARERLDHDDL